MSFKIKSTFGEINIDSFSSLLDEWVIKKSEVILYSKEEEIVKSFIKDFPHIAILGDDFTSKFDYITNLVSRSEKLAVWFAMEKIKYSELAQLPAYLKDLVTPVQFLQTQSKITKVNSTISTYASKKLDITNKYKSDLLKIDKEADSAIEKIIDGDKIVKILTLTTQSLPLSLVNAIESYNANTNDNDFEAKKSLFGREMLTKYKVALLKMILDDDTINVDELIDEISLK